MQFSILGDINKSATCEALVNASSKPPPTPLMRAATSFHIELPVSCFNKALFGFQEFFGWIFSIRPMSRFA
jgi:hypothetical protein